MISSFLQIQQSESRSVAVSDIEDFKLHFGFFFQKGINFDAFGITRSVKFYLFIHINLGKQFGVVGNNQAVGQIQLSFVFKNNPCQFSCPDSMCEIERQNL